VTAKELPENGGIIRDLIIDIAHQRTISTLNSILAHNIKLMKSNPVSLWFRFAGAGATKAISRQLELRESEPVIVGGSPARSETAHVHRAAGTAMSDPGRRHAPST
jgi:hypothetical protein